MGTWIRTHDMGFFFLSGSAGTRGLLVGVLVSIWGLRLAWHIHTETRARLKTIAISRGAKNGGNGFISVHIFRCIFARNVSLLIVIPILLINQKTGSAFGLLDVLGIAVWSLGFYFEATGDAQLARFIRDPKNKGKLMQGGLWAYTVIRIILAK